MEFARQRKQKQLIISNDSFIIKSKQGFINMIICMIFTTIMWIYSFVIFYVFISACFDYNDNFISIVKTALKITNTDIKVFIGNSIVLFLIEFLLLFTWRLYNKTRFGKLNRRGAPNPASDKGMLDLQLISVEDYKILKKEKIIIFEKNPIKELEWRE